MTNPTAWANIPFKLAEIRTAIEEEEVSMDELVTLQSLRDFIDPDDVLLLEWAGVPERIEYDRDTRRHVRAGHEVAVLWTLYATSDVSPMLKVNMKPDFVDDADGTPEVYCRTCSLDMMDWPTDMEWV